jgi:hypothetical protein
MLFASQERVMAQNENQLGKNSRRCQASRINAT